MKCRLTRGAARTTVAVAAVVVLAVSSSGCGTRAAIALNNGTTLHARVVTGYGDEIVAENDEGTHVVPRHAVKEISHPGKAAMIVGASLLAVGSLLFTVAALRDCPVADPEERGFPSGPKGCEFERFVGMFYGTAMGVTGIGVGSYGVGVHQASRDRAQRRLPYEDVRGLVFTGRF